MNVKELFKDDDAVSPVIGVILMVAITVILAAVIGAFVLNLGATQNTAPAAKFEWSYNSSSDHVTLKMTGGESFTDKNTKSLKVEGAPSSTVTVGLPFQAGDEKKLDGSTYSDGDEFELVWTAPGGGKSSVLDTYTVDTA